MGSFVLSSEGELGRLDAATGVEAREIHSPGERDPAGIAAVPAYAVPACLGDAVGEKSHLSAGHIVDGKTYPPAPRERVTDLGRRSERVGPRGLEENCGAWRLRQLDAHRGTGAKVGLGAVVVRQREPWRAREEGSRGDGAESPVV